MELIRTETLSKCIPNIIQSEKKMIKNQCFLKAHKTLITQNCREENENRLLG